MAPATAAPFSVLYLRPEIATGFYSFPSPPSDPNDVPIVPNLEEDAPPPPRPAPPLLPGVPPDEAVHFYEHGRIVDAVKKCLLQHGFLILDQRVIQFNVHELRRLQLVGTTAIDSEVTRRGFFDRFTRGPTLAFLLSLPNGGSPNAAVDTLQSIAGGPSDLAIARREALAAGIPTEHWPLRALCGLNADFPGVHASASIDCAIRERHQLFPPATPTLETAVVVLLPQFVGALPDGKTHLLNQFNLQGIVVTSTIEKPPLSSDDAATIASVELLPSTPVDQRDAFTSLLQSTAAEGPSSTLGLRVIGFHLDATLRSIIGPSSVTQAQLYFPDSVRAQLLSAPLVPLDESIVSSEHSPTCLESGIFFTRQLSVIQKLALEDEGIQSTFAIIKPNAAADADVVGEIQRSIRQFGFAIDRQRRLRLTRAQASAFYAEHVGKPFFERLVAFMTSGEIVALQLSRKLAIPMWRALMGPTNCLVARQTHPWTLRARFGIDGTKNATHGSDSPESARRELRFFLGEAPTNAPTVGECSVQALANLPLAAPFRTPETLEKVVVKGMDALLAKRKELVDPLEACEWLGRWFLAHSEQQTTGALPPTDSVGVGVRKPTKSSSSRRATTPTPTTAMSNVIAIVMDPTMTETVKDAVRDHVQDRIKTMGYTFIEAASVTEPADVGVIATSVKNAGRRRVVLFDASAALIQMWPQDCGSIVISTVVQVQTSAGSPTESANNARQLSIKLAPTFGGEASALTPLFHCVLDPVVALVDDPTNKLSEATLQIVGERYGYALLSFDALVADAIAKENDANGSVTQWRRTNSSLPSIALLNALHRVIQDPGSANFEPATHRFLLVGFPWQSLDANALQQSVGRVARVLQVGSASEWSRKFADLGLVHSVDTNNLVRVGALSLAPRVVVVVGDADTSRIQRAAQDTGAVYIDFTKTKNQSVQAVVGDIRRQLVGVGATFVINGFPHTIDQAQALCLEIAEPAVVVIGGSESTCPPELDRVLEELRRLAPHAVQSTVPTTDAGLVGLLHQKAVALSVGDVGPLDANTLRSKLGSQGVGVIDLRGSKSTDTNSVLTAVANCAYARCIVLGGTTMLDQIQSLQSVFGEALHRVLVLKHRKQVPPRKQRDPSDDNDEYDSEEEAERERQQLAAATTLSPELSSIVQAYANCRRPRVEVVSFLSPHTAYNPLASSLQPQLVSVLGHRHIFYQEAVVGVCVANQLPYIDLANVGDGKVGADAFETKLGRLQHITARSFSSALVVDGFPHAVAVDGTRIPPYVAQQLQQIEQRVGKLVSVVRFRTSLEVLLERKPTHMMRGDIEDAHDALELATGELAKHCDKTLVEVTCEREVADAKDQFVGVLLARGVGT